MTIGGAVRGDFDLLAAEVLRIVELPSSEPPDIRAVAERLGVATIKETSMFEDGRLEILAGQPVVLVKEGVSRARQNFTIAHELGHLVLTTKTDGLVGRRAPKVDAEERWCDRLAAALLMPAPWVRDVTMDRGPSLQVAESVRRRADVSLSAAVLRLRSVCGWDASLARWRRYDGRWICVAAVGVSPAIRTGLNATDGPQLAFERMSPYSRREFKALCVGATDLGGIVARGQASRRGDSVILFGRAEVRPQDRQSGVSSLLPPAGAPSLPARPFKTARP